MSSVCLLPHLFTSLLLLTIVVFDVDADVADNVDVVDVVDDVEVVEVVDVAESVEVAEVVEVEVVVMMLVVFYLYVVCSVLSVSECVRSVIQPWSTSSASQTRTQRWHMCFSVVLHEKAWSAQQSVFLRAFRSRKTFHMAEDPLVDIFRDARGTEKFSTEAESHLFATRNAQDTRVIAENWKLDDSGESARGAESLRITSLRR